MHELLSQSDTELQNQNPIFIYTDESGNTGLNIFDKNQPYFYTASLISNDDVNVIGKIQFELWKSQLGVEELHGNELGFIGIGKISYQLKEFIESNGLKFVFTRIEKGHVAALKLVDTILDSGLNMAVSPIHYNNRFFRLSLSYELAKNISPANKVKFWLAYEKEDISSLREILRKLKWNISNKIKDTRLRQLLTDAITWAYDNPDKVFAKRTNMDAPNMVAFGLLIQGIQKQLGIDGTNRVKRFIHDEQSQFAKYMKFMYKHFKDLSFSMDDFGWATDYMEVDIYDCNIEFISSKSQYGLQLVDVCLWIVKQALSKNNKLDTFSNCKDLLDFLANKSVLSDFTMEQLKEYVYSATLELSRMDLNPYQLSKGRELMALSEQHREERLKKHR